MSTVKERDLEEVNEILTMAKLSESDILPTSQMIYFSAEGSHDNKYKFLQLDQHLLEELKEGEALQIKGDDDENVVLCTKCRTYDVVEAETSNSLLLINNMKFMEDLKDQNVRTISKATVSGIFYEYLDATPSKPRLKKLRQLLTETIYRGPEHESEINVGDLLTYEDLSRSVQASDEELKNALNTMHVVTVDSKIRLLDFEYHFRVLSHMLKLIEENSWALDEIDFEETVNSLKDFIPEEIVMSLFDKYAQESSIIDGLQLYSYKEADVCKFFAQVVLYAAGKFNLDEFLQAWRESVPEGMVPDEELLHGIAIINRKSDPNIISAFSEEDLPEDVNERFHALFKAKEKWTVPEITPYIQRLATDKLDVNALLAKHARASKELGVKCYSAKHAK